MHASLSKPTATNAPTLPPAPQATEARPRINLTRKELEVMEWAVMGKSSWEIAQILECTESAVNYHFANIRVKFKVSSRWAALRKAAEMGLVQL
ncbi:helix-turn-helix transcriptional regulator [Pseudomonas batumici]|uniref:N-3-oxododecanoyl-L-homoserine lactone quorum-sensing transcriptional activator, Transcriptional regulator LasR n=1 Tax=Pseudomonas batumici TaxID=226910 RepID=A0A0C2IHM1_9PSED|nr:helix-turn-helix transcriptional regulator [Pseudomonas batumici]KIH84402.1 N-3-oxododecanoyl-L-homoserine lactone quorum-sensing transcriptional activator, Transcriptional regulator LasR [Pseudomonas batumici]